MVGRSDRLEVKKAVDHWKTSGLDLSGILYQPSATDVSHCVEAQNHGLEKSLDDQVLLDICGPALQKGEKVSAIVPIQNTNRVVGTILGSEVTKKYGAKGLPEDTINLNFKGSAGQSFGAFVPKGISLTLEGDSNDYIGKGLSGGKIVVYPPKSSSFKTEENIIIGNVAFYGATRGEAYISGAAGERFCVRNSGVNAVVEAVGDHGCEYMTGGNVVVLGSTGRNFAAGMSGGIAYVLDTDGSFRRKCNMASVELEALENIDEANKVKEMIQKHVKYTGSELGKKVLADWSHTAAKFVKIISKDYKRMLKAINDAERNGFSGEDALMAAFEANNSDSLRVSGN
jgi:glutamate synthase (ferredoxin)